MGKVHKGENPAPFKCAFCDRGFAWSITRAKHEKTCRDRDDSFTGVYCMWTECVVCGVSLLVLPSHGLKREIRNWGRNDSDMVMSSFQTTGLVYASIFMSITRVSKLFAFCEELWHVSECLYVRPRYCRRAGAAERKGGGGSSERKAARKVE